jgi:hypothetical protein
MKKHASKASGADRSSFTELEQLPNVGPAVAADLRLLGLVRPGDLVGRDPYQLYDELCRVTKQRHDPCVLDTFIAAVRFMGGEEAKPWWAYTAERKRRTAQAPNG